MDVPQRANFERSNSFSNSMSNKVARRRSNIYDLLNSDDCPEPDSVSMYTPSMRWHSRSRENSENEDHTHGKPFERLPITAYSNPFTAVNHRPTPKTPYQAPTTPIQEPATPRRIPAAPAKAIINIGGPLINPDEKQTDLNDGTPTKLTPERTNMDGSQPPLNGNEKSRVKERLEGRPRRSPMAYDPTVLVPVSRLSAGDRFCKNLGIWLQDEAKQAVEDNKTAGAKRPETKEVEISDWTLVCEGLEKLAGRLLPCAASNKINFRKPDSDVLGVIQKVAGDNWTSKNVHHDPSADSHGLLDVEMELCRHLGFKHTQYRSLKARIVIGFACIHQHNLNGSCKGLRQCHPSVRRTPRKPPPPPPSPPSSADDDTILYDFACINTGRSQAQMILVGVDVNDASILCGVFQEWGWLPSDDPKQKFSTTIPSGVGKLPEMVENIFPEKERSRVTSEFAEWEVRKQIPSLQRLVITKKDFGSQGCTCGCRGIPTVHFAPPLNKPWTRRPAAGRSVQAGKLPTSSGQKRKRGAG